MKKFLAFLLSLALIVSLLPATFASAADASEAPANENLQIVYGITGNAAISGTALGSGTDLYKNVLEAISTARTMDVNDYSKTGGFWKYYASTSQWEGTCAGAWGLMNLYVNLDQWIAFKFYVPASGKYDLTVVGGCGSDGSGGRFSYTLLEGNPTKAEITAAVSNVKWENETLLGNALGQLNCDQADIGVNATTTHTSKVTLDEGEHIIVLKTIERGSHEYESYNSRIYLRGFGLTNGDGSKTVPMGFTAVDKTSLKVGETATASVAGDLYGSNDWMKKTYDASEITFVSSDTSVATVSGSTVTAVGEGEAEISAIVDGATLHSATVNVAGENENMQIVYGIAPGTAFTSTSLDGTTDLWKELLTSIYTDVAVNTITSYSQTSGFWKFHKHQTVTSGFAASTMTFYGQLGGLYVNYPDDWIAFKFRVPVSGKYDLTVGAGSGNANEAGGRWSYSILDGDATNDEIIAAVKSVAWDAATETLSGNALGQLNSDPDDVGANATTTHTSKVDLEAGEYLIVLKTIEKGTAHTNKWDSYTTRIFFKGFSLKNGDGSKTIPMGTTSLEASELTEGETTIPSAVAYGSNDWMTYEGETVTYKSSDPTVAAVVGNDIVAKKEGTAEITAVVDGIELVPATVTVLPKYEQSPANTSIFVASNDKAAVPNSNITVTVGGAPKSAGEVISGYRNALVKVTAPETVGKYRFKYWLGTGKIESFEPEYSFSNFTNKALLAVYEEIPAEGQATVTFYKQNKEIVDSKVVDKGTTFGAAKPAARPTLIGYANFMGWFLGEDVKAEDTYVIEKDTEVVALFDGANAVTGITVNGEAVGDMSYGDAKTVTAENANFSYWKRGDKIVSYNNAYTFYAWQDNASFTAVNDGAVDAEVVAVLDKRGEDYVLEYEVPADCVRLEVGIIFGENANITVDSCFAKVVSQKDDARGFLAASADDFDYAKGYVIFRDANGVTRVAYSD